jgi:hypothetical protein
LSTGRAVLVIGLTAASFGNSPNKVNLFACTVQRNDWKGAKSETPSSNLSFRSPPENGHFLSLQSNFDLRITLASPIDQRKNAQCRRHARRRTNKHCSMEGQPQFLALHGKYRSEKRGRD